MESFDVIVIGAGHAGAEAAYAASKMGLCVGLFTLHLDAIGRMPCSPSIGGLGKSHLVKEIDALGGLMAEVADATAIQYKVLNMKKGPAVRATRTQNDRFLYEKAVRAKLEKQESIHIIQSRIDTIEITDGKIKGVKDYQGIFYPAKAVVIATGTFLSGLIHIGETKTPAGRVGEEGAYELPDSLKNLGFSLGRFKTGTPPRLNGDTINLASLKRQDPDEEFMPLGFSSPQPTLPQVPCYITKTTPITHALIRDNICLSPLYSGAITGKPARYCPSLEDKIMKFGDRDGHQIIIEPEGLDTKEVYASGLGNSMPVDLQWKIVQSVPGLEKVEIVKPAYAIEYDYVLPHQLDSTLQTKTVKGLYLAGQINGTSGYEEAAAQGLIAGINAALAARGEKPFILDRSQTYIWVMIDDLITKGTSEPYRIFTSRSEHRLMLRETNAIFRLSEYAKNLGLIKKERFENIQNIQRQIQETREYFSKTYVSIPEKYNTEHDKPTEKSSIEQLLKRPEIKIQDLVDQGLMEKIQPLAMTELEIEIKYEGYIKRQQRDIERFKNLEELILPDNLNYEKISGLSNELKTRLSSIRPKTLGQASRIEGMTPAGLQAIQIGLKLFHSKLS
jgi:tRNA uridine 5-carboxymethylaminomethyl modification enzyme